MVVRSFHIFCRICWSLLQTFFKLLQLGCRYLVVRKLLISWGLLSSMSYKNCVTFLLNLDLRVWSCLRLRILSMGGLVLPMILWFGISSRNHFANFLNAHYELHLVPSQMRTISWEEQWKIVKIDQEYRIVLHVRLRSSNWSPFDQCMHLMILHSLLKTKLKKMYARVFIFLRVFRSSHE